MGFMDKAKKMAEQAQAKLDDAQKQFNSGQGSQQAGGAAPVEYDDHGRPIQPAPVVPDAGAPVVETPGVPPTTPPAPPAAAPAPPAAAPAPPAAAAPAPGPAAPEDRNRPGTEPPKMSSGDPLAG